MDPEQLWETTMDPATRIMIRVEHGRTRFEADEIFTILMGDKVGSAVRNSSKQNAKYVSNLDI